MEHHNKINKNKQPSLTPKTVQTKAIYLQDNRPSSILQKKINNTGLPNNLKSGIENLSGHAMDDVKVHYNSNKPAQLNAHAYAQGTDIHIASGQEKHLPHEAWHVVQQKQGRVKPTLQMKGKVNVNDEDGLEKEADVMGEKAIQMVDNRNSGLFPLIQPANEVISSTTQLVGKQKNPIQLQLNRRTIIDGTKPKWGIDEGFRSSLLVAIDKFNKEEKRGDHSKENVYKNLERLDTIEHKLYAWFDENKTDTYNKNRRGLFQLIDEVQENHKYWVDANVNEGHSMWTKDKIDNKDEKDEMDSIWAHIVNGDGAFSIKDKVHTVDDMKDLPDTVLKKFKIEIFASLARLYSRPKGRALLKALNDGHADGKTIEFVMSPIYKIMGTPGYAEAPYVGAKASSTNEGAATIKLKGVKKKNKKIVRGKGSGAGVEIAPGVKDASMVDFDEKGNQILSPNFIGVGHELVHAAHYGAGTYIGMKPGIGAPHATVPGDYEDDVEEFMTIASKNETSKAKDTKVTSTLNKLSGGSQKHTFKLSKLEELNLGIPTEAEIREEHGLTIRHGHTTSANPVKYRGAKKEENPGIHIQDGINWITPHLNKITPPRVRTVVPRVQAPQQIVVNRPIYSFLKALGITVAIGGIIATGLLLKYGYPLEKNKAE
ncbi:eCIS core domain-containing protein [Flavobacterium sp. HNIBRBA15423]|uniref:eCIS core domain-containing protein n=1 Tax=Flavobacterium sp. HNIBRBA15423 TaxID=3458683 RepID=UPI004043D888